MKIAFVLESVVDTRYFDLSQLDPYSRIPWDLEYAVQQQRDYEDRFQKLYEDIEIDTDTQTFSLYGELSRSEPVGLDKHGSDCVYGILEIFRLAGQDELVSIYIGTEQVWSGFGPFTTEFVHALVKSLRIPVLNDLFCQNG